MKVNIKNIWFKDNLNTLKRLNNIKLNLKTIIRP